MTAEEQAGYDQEVMNMRLMLDPDMVYTAEHLKSSAVLERSLRLLYRARFGQEQGNVRISAHLVYNALPKRALQAIAAGEAASKARRRELMQRLSHLKPSE